MLDGQLKHRVPLVLAGIIKLPACPGSDVDRLGVRRSREKQKHQDEEWGRAHEGLRVEGAGSDGSTLGYTNTIQVEPVLGYSVIAPLECWTQRSASAAHGDPMALWPKVAVIILAGLLVANAMILWIGISRQQRSLARLLRELVSHAGAAPPPVFPALESLPPPVARYFMRAFPRGPVATRIARFEQRGELRTEIEAQRWLPFDATHVVTPLAPGFVWNARVRIAPLLHVRVRDALVQGRGSGQVALLSAVRVSAAEGEVAMNSGSLHRFLAEAVWYPTALLPSSRLQWTGVNDSTALATLTDHGLSVSLEFRFNAAGEVAAIYTPARWGTFHGHYEQRAWEGHFRNYQVQGDVVVPSEGDVGWYVDGRWEPVWRGRILSVE
jgi:hypothetical protein